MKSSVLFRRSDTSFCVFGFWYVNVLCIISKLTPFNSKFCSFVPFTLGYLLENHILVAIELGRELSLRQLSWNNFPSKPVVTLDCPKWHLAPLASLSCFADIT